VDELGARAQLARFVNAGEGSSSGGSSRAPLLQSEDDELVPARSSMISAGDYVHGSDEQAVLAQVDVISEAEARARFYWEEAHAVRQVREYEARRREERVRRVKLEIVELEAEEE
jgi:hypothetical protein